MFDCEIIKSKICSGVMHDQVVCLFLETFNHSRRIFLSRTLLCKSFPSNSWSRRWLIISCHICTKTWCHNFFEPKCFLSRYWITLSWLCDSSLCFINIFSIVSSFAILRSATTHITHYWHVFIVCMSWSPQFPIWLSHLSLK